MAWLLLITNQFIFFDFVSFLLNPSIPIMLIFQGRS
jgi:hypothetical protein